MSSRRIRTPQDLGATIRDARSSLGLTQAQLAERADVSREWVIGVEQGKRSRAELTKLLTVLTTLGISLYAENAPREEVEKQVPPRDSPTSNRTFTTNEVTRNAIEAMRSSLGTPGALHADGAASVAKLELSPAIGNALAYLRPNMIGIAQKMSPMLASSMPAFSPSLLSALTNINVAPSALWEAAESDDVELSSMTEEDEESQAGEDEQAPW